MALVPIIAGIACAVYAGAARWREAIRNTDARFALLLVGFAVLPVLVVIVLDSTLYNGWRHMFFLYAPLCPLAALGARRIWAALSDRNPRFRLALGALAALGIAAVVVQMVRLHPYQSDYFNLLVNRNVSGQYEVDYWDLSRRDALEWLLETYPDQHLIVRGEIESRWDLDRNLFIMPEEDRRRISVREELAHFHIAESGENPFWTREVYGAPMVAVMDTRAATESAYRAAHETAAALEPVAESGFDMFTWTARRSSTSKSRARRGTPVGAFFCPPSPSRRTICRLNSRRSAWTTRRSISNSGFKARFSTASA